MNTVFVYEPCPPCATPGCGKPAYPGDLCAGCEGRKAAAEILEAVFGRVFPRAGERS